MTESEALLFAAQRLAGSGEAGMAQAVLFLRGESYDAVREEAIWILDCFASTPSLNSFDDYVEKSSADLAQSAFEAAPGYGTCSSEYAEAAQILRDGWNPGDELEWF